MTRAEIEALVRKYVPFDIAFPSSLVDALHAAWERETLALKEQIVEEWNRADAAEARVKELEQEKEQGMLLYDGKCEEISECESRLAALEETLKRKRRGISAVLTLINESRGVAGLHLNGDEAPWDELRTGGRFEEWLRDFDTALAADARRDGA